MSAANRRFTSDALNYAFDRYVGDDPEKVEAFEIEAANADVAREIRELRTRAGLTRTQLAKRIGTSPSVVGRLEDADYEGHSLAMLRRVAAALDRRVEIRFVATERPG